MKGLFIVGKEMPRNCGECWNCDCNFTDEQDNEITVPMCLCAFLPVDADSYKKSCPFWCPIVEVELPDTDELINKQKAMEVGKMLLGLMQQFNKKHKGEI